jgi:hypothetical protein
VSRSRNRGSTEKDRVFVPQKARNVALLIHNYRRLVRERWADRKSVAVACWLVVKSVLGAREGKRISVSTLAVARWSVSGGMG